MSNFMPFVPSDLSANAQPPENAVNEQTDRWTDRQTNNNIHKHLSDRHFIELSYNVNLYYVYIFVGGCFGSLC